MGSAPSKWVALPEEPPGLKPMSLLLPQTDNNNTNKMKKNTTKYFICEDTTIGDEALLYFYRCTDLISLDISYSPKLHDDVVAELLPEFKLLNELNLEGCFDLGHHTVEAIIQNCKMIDKKIACYSLGQSSSQG